MLELDRELLEGVAELEEALVLADRAREGRELVDKLPEVLLVPLVVGDQVLAPLEEGRRAPVGPLRGRVALDLERGLDEGADVCEEADTYVSFMLMRTIWTGRRATHP